MITTKLRRSLFQNTKQICFYSNKLQGEQRINLDRDEELYKQKTNKPGLDKNKDEAREDRKEFGSFTQATWKSDSFKREQGKDYNVEEKMADLKRGKFNRDGQPINEAEAFRDQ